MFGRVDIKTQKVKKEVTGTEKHRFWLIYMKILKKFTFLGPVTSILTFLHFFSKMRQTILTLSVISSFVKFFVAQTSRTRFFSSIVEKLISPPFINQSS